MRIRDLVLVPLGMLVTAVLYIPLTLVPVFGPLIAGFMGGTVSGRGGGFLTGFLAASLGSVALFQMLTASPDIAHMSSTYLIFGWMFLVWNLVGAFLAGAGWSFASMSFGSGEMFSRGGRTAGKRRPAQGVRRDAPKVETYIICRNCGSANPENYTVCKSCGKDLTEA